MTFPERWVSISCSCQKKEEGRLLFHSQFQMSELPLSHVRILEEPLAVLSGSERDRDEVSERSFAEEPFGVYQTDWEEF